MTDTNYYVQNRNCKNKVRGIVPPLLFFKMIQMYSIYAVREWLNM